MLRQRVESKTLGTPDLATNKTSDVVAAGGVIRKRPETPMESEEEPASKRIKLSTNSANTSRACADTNWANIPILVLYQISLFISKADAESLAFTCKQWSRIITFPFVRTLSLICDRKQEPIVNVLILKLLPSAIQNLSVDFRETKDVVITVKDSLSYVLHLMRYFVEHKTDKLVSLRLANMSRIVVRLNKFRKHKDFILTLRRFLEIQTHLIVLNLSCAGFTLEQGTAMLTKVGRSCGSKIEKLIVDGLFAQEENKDLVAVALLEPFRLFTALTSLTISIHLLNTEMLKVMGMMNKLQELKIVMHDMTVESKLNENDWRTLKQNLQLLEVEIVCKNDINYYFLRCFLSKEMPLKKFSWKVDHEIISHSWCEDHVGCAISYLAQIATETIKEVHVELQTCPTVVSHIFNHIIDCANLERLSIKVPDSNVLSFGKMLMANINENSHRCTMKYIEINGRECEIQKRLSTGYHRGVVYNVYMPESWFA